MAQKKPTSIRIERDFDVPPPKVWRAWTDAAVVSKWFGSDPQGKVLAATLDVHPGGAFEVTFKDSSGAQHTCGGQYVEVEPEARLTFKWHWLAEPGVETFVSVELSRVGSGTHMTFEHARLFAASAHDYDAGWRRTFEKLACVLQEES